LQLPAEALAEEYVVAEDQSGGVRPDEVLSDDEGLGQSFGARLHLIGER
jgi:hypothetical protein